MITGLDYVQNVLSNLKEERGEWMTNWYEEKYFDKLAVIDVASGKLRIPYYIILPLIKELILLLDRVESFGEESKINEVSAEIVGGYLLWRIVKFKTPERVKEWLWDTIQLAYEEKKFGKLLYNYALNDFEVLFHLFNEVICQMVSTTIPRDFGDKELEVVVHYLKKAGFEKEAENVRLITKFKIEWTKALEGEVHERG